jgi:hypothetical protein
LKNRRREIGELGVGREGNTEYRGEKESEEES